MVVLVLQGLTALLFLAIGVLVYIRARTHAINISFSVFCALTAAWLATSFTWNLQNHLGIYTDWLPRLSMAVVCLAANSLLVFSGYFPSSSGFVSRPRVGFSYLLALVVGVLSFTPWSVRGSKLVGGVYIREFGPLYLLFAGYTTTAASLAIFNLALSYRRLRFSIQRQKVKHVFFGLLLSIPTMMLLMFLLPYLGISRLFFVGQVSLILFIGFTAYAILRYRALDISKVAFRTLTWILTATVVVSTIYFVISLSRRWFRDQNDFTLTLLATGLFMVLLFFYQRVRPTLSRFFQRKALNMGRVLEAFSRELSLLKSLEELLGVIDRTLREALGADNVTVLVVDAQGLWHMARGMTPALALPGMHKHEAFFRWLEKENDLVQREEVQVNPRYEAIQEQATAYLHELNAEMVVPLVFNRRLLGLLNLGPRVNQEEYDSVDLQLLTILRNDISVALSNSQLYEKVNALYQEVKTFNQTLERRVAERTADLEKAMEQLRHLDQLKSDFIAMASHELRTPITAVKGAISLTLEYLEDESDRGKMRHFLEMSRRNIERIINLINDLLDLSKMEAGKLEMQPEPFAFQTMLNAVLESLQPQLEKKRLHWISRVEPPDLVFTGDADRLRQVIINLLDNAIKFSPEQGKVRVSAEVREGQFTCSVTDEGGGIPAQNQQNIFDKFWHREGYTQEAEEGTGLGLAIARKIVELHHGRIWVESREGAGSTFTFQIPARPAAEPEKAGGSLM